MGGIVQPVEEGIDQQVEEGIGQQVGGIGQPVEEGIDQRVGGKLQRPRLRQHTLLVGGSHHLVGRRRK